MRMDKSPNNNTAPNSPGGHAAMKASPPAAFGLAAEQKDYDCAGSGKKSVPKPPTGSFAVKTVCIPVSIGGGSK